MSWGNDLSALFWSFRSQQSSNPFRQGVFRIGGGHLSVRYKILWSDLAFGGSPHRRYRRRTVLNLDRRIPCHADSKTGWHKTGSRFQRSVLLHRGLRVRGGRLGAWHTQKGLTVTWIRARMHRRQWPTRRLLLVHAYRNMAAQIGPGDVWGRVRKGDVVIRSGTTAGGGGGSCTTWSWLLFNCWNEVDMKIRRYSGRLQLKCWIK